MWTAGVGIACKVGQAAAAYWPVGGVVLIARAHSARLFVIQKTSIQVLSNDSALCSVNTGRSFYGNRC